MSIYLYDPRTNITKIVTGKEVAGITGRSYSTLSHAKRRGSKLKSINCYLSDEEPSLKQRREWYAKETYPDEYFVTVEGSENQFLVSNYGRIKRIYKNGNERFMMPFQRKGKGNLLAKLRFLGKYDQHKIGHIVAYHFIRPRKESERLIRKNGIVTDDYAGNLKYVTLKELGKRTGYQSKSKPVIQLALKTDKVINEYRSAREAGRKNFMSYQTVLDNCNRKTKLAAGVTRFMFLEDYEKRKTMEIS